MKNQNELMIEVFPYYNKYIETISADYMAASIECCSFLMELCFLQLNINTLIKFIEYLL